MMEVVSGEENPGTVCFRTKGGASAHPDNGFLEAAHIIGKVIFSVDLDIFLFPDSSPIFSSLSKTNI